MSSSERSKMSRIKSKIFDQIEEGKEGDELTLNETEGE